ncbi:MAG: hypothetical protein KF901_17695 [Myxococcales bacterium]|nr:hypothetical protein [Myxococcales bacterium]
MKMGKDLFLAILAAVALAAPACGGGSEAPANDPAEGSSGDEYTEVERYDESDSDGQTDEGYQGEEGYSDE